MIQYSLYSRFTSNVPIMKAADDWSDFVFQMAELAEPRLANDKTKRSATPAISPAIYAEGTVRADENVLGWGGWIALDVDNALDVLLPVTVETTRDVLDGLGLNYLLYGSTKSTIARPRYRVVLPTSRHVSKSEYRTVWAAVVEAFAEIGPDPSCKDASRIYGGPSNWLAADDGNPEPYNIFEFRIDGADLDVDDLLEGYTPPVEEAPRPVPVFSKSATVERSSGRIKQIKPGSSIQDSPIVSGEAVTAYLNLSKGEHHQGLFTFVCSVLGRAKAKGFDVSDDQIEQYCRQLDAIAPISTSKDRWSRIRYEISRARRYVA